MASGASKDSGDAQVPPTRATGPESATGVALGQQDKEIPSGKDRGSQQEPEGGWPQPDWDAPEPQGAQVEPARFTSNGQLPHNTVPSPTGAVPVGALGLSAEDSQARVDEVIDAHDAYVERRDQRQFIAPETVQRLSKTDLRVIASQRGYAVPPDAGTRATREAFLAEQDIDQTINKPSDKKGKKASDADTPAT